MNLTTVCFAQGRRVPERLNGELVDSASLLDESGALQTRLAADGYLLLRGVLDAEAVMAAREEVFHRLLDVGEIRSPAVDGVPTGRSRRKELVGELGPFWKSVSEGAKLRAVTHGIALHRAMAAVLGTPARAHDYIFLRTVPIGASYGLHFDHPYFTRLTDRVCTVWIPFGVLEPGEGSLAIVEGSHRFEDLIAALAGSAWRQGPPMVDTVPFLLQRNARLLTCIFQPGDVLVFGMYTMHGSLDNRSPRGRVRLSCDMRYQPVCEPLDKRYVGPDPCGVGGFGYGSQGEQFSLSGD